MLYTDTGHVNTWLYVLNQTARSATGVFCMVKYPNPNRGHNPAWEKKKQPSLVSRDHLSISYKQPHNNNISNLLILSLFQIPQIYIYIYIYYPSKGLISTEKKKEKKLLSFTYRYMTLSLSLSLSSG